MISGEMSRHLMKCRDIRRNVATSGEMSRHPVKCRDIWRNVATSGEKKSSPAGKNKIYMLIFGYLQKKQRIKTSGLYSLLFIIDQ
jgi:hypothetical protein